MRNTNLYNGKQRYAIQADNGQILEHGFTSQTKCRERIKAYKKMYPNNRFYVWGYETGTYGNE